MSDVNYEPVIQDMTWSYSRVHTILDCPYEWYLKYIRGLSDEELFFSSFGKFMHSLLELYFTKKETKENLITKYLCEFGSNVIKAPPNWKVYDNYFQSGLRYLETLSPPQCSILGVEKEVKFEIKTDFKSYPFVGYIDLLAEKDDKLYIIDHKSRNLSKRSKGKKYTKTDQELDEYLRQLYLYSIAVKEEYGRHPDALVFNCFRVPLIIEEPFKEDRLEEAKEWAISMIKEIKMSEFKPKLEYFKCKHICGYRKHCEYYPLCFDSNYKK